MNQDTQTLDRLAGMLAEAREGHGKCPVQNEAELVSAGEQAKYCSNDAVKCQYKGERKGFVGQDRFGHVSIDMNSLCRYEGNAEE